ncbi:hypothetical protein BH23PSE1_BH23PSE1_11950 [soil metagenome]
MRPSRLAAAGLAAFLAIQSAGHSVSAQQAAAGAEHAVSAGTLAEADGLVVADGAALSVGAMARTGAGYFTVTNSGAEADRLVAAESPAAERVELHIHRLEDGIARMEELTDGVPVPAGGTVEFAQGGLHVMFLGLTDAWREEGVPVTLVFERAGPVDVLLPRSAPPAAGGHDHSPAGGHDHSGSGGHDHSSGGHDAR